MSIDRPESELLGILTELRKLPRETEWVEFKHNNAEPDEIGEYLSALANAAALTGKVHAWLVWGVSNGTHEVVGTTFNPATMNTRFLFDGHLMEHATRWGSAAFDPRITNNLRAIWLIDGYLMGAAFRAGVGGCICRSTNYTKGTNIKTPFRDFRVVRGQKRWEA